MSFSKALHPVHTLLSFPNFATQHKIHLFFQGNRMPKKDLYVYINKYIFGVVYKL